MTKQLKLAIKEIPYYTKITSKGRYSGIKGKAWSILSDFVRMRDFIKYKICVSCGKTIWHWRDTDAGHFISMSGHGALIGFHPDNINAQCKNCNQISSPHIGAQYERCLEFRLEERGMILVRDLHSISQKSIKADDWFFLEKIREIYEAFKDLQLSYPDYDYPEYMIQ